MLPKYENLGQGFEGKYGGSRITIAHHRRTSSNLLRITIPRTVLKKALQLHAAPSPNPTTYEIGPVDVPPQPHLYRSAEKINLETPSLAVMQARSPFRPESIVILEAVARNFAVADVKIGKNSQFLSVRPIPAALFSDKALREVFAFQKLDPLQTLTISVVNTTDRPQKFTASVTGSHSDKPTDCRTTILGLGMMEIPARKTILVNLEPFVETEIRRLVIPSHIARHFTIRNILVRGLDAHVWSRVAKSRPATHFSENRPGLVYLDHNPDRGLYLSLEVANTSSEPRVFTGAFTGDEIS